MFILQVGDVAKSGACDRFNQIAIVDLNLSEGYAAHSDWATIHLISVIHLKLYNG